MQKVPALQLKMEIVEMGEWLSGLLGLQSNWVNSLSKK